MIKVNADFVYKEMKDLNLFTWSLQDGNAILAEQQVENYGIDESLGMLKDRVSAIMGDTITIVASNKTKAQKSKGGSDYIQRKYLVTLGGSGGFSGIGSVRGSDGLYQQILELKSQLISQQYDSKFKELERKLEEKADPIEKYIGIFGPMIAAKMGFDMPAAPVAGIAGPPGTTETLLTQWRGIDPKIEEVIRAIVRIGSADPETYRTFRNMLLNHGA